MENFTAVSGAAKLAGIDSGGGSPANVFLHAGVADHRSWLPLIERLRDLRAIAYDRRGFGGSSWEPERFSHLGDLESVFEDRGLDGKVGLWGNSQGGRIALDFALAHPNRVAFLMLIAPAISGAPEPPIESYSEVIQRQAAALEAAEKAEDVDAVNEIEAQLWLDGPKESPGRVGGAVRELFLDMNGGALRAPPTGEEVEPPSAYDRIESLQVPVTFVCGSLDFAGVIERCRDLAARAPNGRFELLEGLAHVPQLENPDALAGIALPGSA